MTSDAAPSPRTPPGPARPDGPSAPRSGPRISAGEWTVAALGYLYYCLPPILVLLALRASSQHLPLLVTAVVVGAATVVALPLARRRPVAFTLALAVALLATPGAVGPALVGVARVARQRPGRLAVLTAAALVAGKSLAVATYGWPVGSPAMIEWTITCSAIVVAALVGRLSRSHAAERARAVEAEDARREAWEARVNEARLAERERIAREMHDVVAHRISLIALHSGALAHRMDALAAPPAEGGTAEVTSSDADTAGAPMPPAGTSAAPTASELGEAAELARLIQGNARASLDELRAMLATLRGADAPPEPPQPTLADLDALIAEARAAGQRITLHRTGELDATPTRLSRHAYRIIQEGLTNARKHAPGSPVTLRVEAGGEGVHLRVTNPLADLAAPNRTGSGLGLVGVVERVEQLGGDVAHGVQGGEFSLDAHLPVR